MNVKCIGCHRIWHVESGLHRGPGMLILHCMWCAPDTCVTCKMKRLLGRLDDAELKRKLG